MNAIEAFVPSEVVKTFTAFLEFCYIARRNIITDDSLEQLKVALHKFHDSRQVFSGTVRAEGPSGFSLPQQHTMVHYYDHIKNFGSPNGLCSSITESKHIAAVKRPWRRSNKHTALPQMLKINERLDKLAAARADFTARGMLVDSFLVQAIAAGDSEDAMDEDGYNSDETDVLSPDEIDVLNRDHPPNIDHGARAPNNPDTPSLDNMGARTPDDTVDDNDDPYQLNRESPMPPDDEEDDHGPVESGPLMNKVHLACRKGKVSLPQGTYKH